MSLPVAELPGRLESSLARHIGARRADIESLCAEARERSFRAVCVTSSCVELARALLEDSAVQVVALVGFPHGAIDSDAKRFETEVVVDQGAHEVDFVLNLGMLKDGDHKAVLREMRDIVEAADERPVSAVLESHLLTHDEKIRGCELALDSGVKQVCASLQFNPVEPMLGEVALLHKSLGGELAVKTFADIRTVRQAMVLLDAGAARIGMMAGVTLA